MEIRGERECKECNTRWSYFQTGSVACPDCGSLVSVGTGGRKLHTDAPVELELTDVIAAIDDEPLAAAMESVPERCREYAARRGFLRGGELVSLDDVYLTAVELRHAADIVGRLDEPTTQEELYVVSLLRAVDTGERPPASDVPERFHETRGLAAADAADSYRSAITRLVEPSGELRTALSRLRERTKRIDALDGNVSPAEAAAVVRAARAIGRGVRADDDDAIREGLDALAADE